MMVVIMTYDKFLTLIYKIRNVTKTFCWILLWYLTRVSWVNLPKCASKPNVILTSSGYNYDIYSKNFFSFPLSFLNRIQTYIKRNVICHTNVTSKVAMLYKYTNCPIIIYIGKYSKDFLLSFLVSPTWVSL